MTPSELREIGEALYGDRWQTYLANSLGVSDRTVRRWAAGSFPVPPGVLLDLRELVKERISELKSADQTLAQIAKRLAV